MSKAQLPPRFPSQNKTISQPHCNASKNLHLLHRDSSSEASVPEEQPDWLNDLLGETDSNLKGIFNLASSSDSSAYSTLNSHSDEEKSVGKETCSAFESACVYGPNSPRQRGNSNFLEKAIASVLSEYATQDPSQHGNRSPSASRATTTESKVDSCGSVVENNADTKPAKRHPAQRSRARKLQYIAELERTVDALQAFESELAAKVAAVLQQRTALCVENTRLKQQVIRLQQEKLLLEGQYRFLKKEAESLKMGLAKSPYSTVATHFGSTPFAESPKSEAMWQLLDIGNLSLK